MILIYPHNADWDYIAELTGDASWKSSNMRQYFEPETVARHEARSSSCRKAQVMRTRRAC